ncbi:hypothetical protein M885DRAFT_564117 [Pelagophyceae sp. CCMP2097]|nr:hypothetical protein M885DRAFT_564117 [Pelagophyceae sp. CCMP2097]
MSLERSPDGLVFPRARNYKNVSGAVVQSWRGGGRWFTQQWKVTHLENSTLIFDPSTGMQGGEGMTSSGQWWIENVLEECDAEREWFFDEAKRLLYWNPNGTAALTGFEKWTATKARVLFDVSGTSEKPVVGLTLRGLRFIDARHTYLDPHGMPSGGDWALQRNGALTLEGTVGMTISNCAFERVDGVALSANGFHRGLVISGNDFSWIGDTSATVLKDNVHFNGPRAGVNFNDGFAGGDLIQGNLLANCVRESGDHGPINSWDRMPYIFDHGAGATVQPEFRQIRRNFIFAVYSSQEAIDNDDGSSYYNATSNFFAYGQHGLKSDYGGHHNLHSGNVYAWVQDAYLQGVSDAFEGNVVIANSFDEGFASDCELAPKMTVSGNLIYTKSGNLSTKICDKSNIVVGKWPPASKVAEMAREVLFD